MRGKLAVAGALCLALAGCGAMTHPLGQPAVTGSSQPDASMANAYLAGGSDWVDYIQWDSTGTGSLTDDTITGTAPDEQVSGSQTPVTAYVNGSEVTFSGLNPENGTL